ncbi:hypothetical protein HYX05_01150 [Candidatus Woesearchaeota archaeon]|nr:hypothetical protein [Candidatus Woesearchaeota archaeon]
MALDDFLNDPEADAELRAGTQKRPKVTQEEHKRYVQDRMFEIVNSLVSSHSQTPDGEHQKVVDKIRQLSVAYEPEDISVLGTRLSPYVYNGLFLSALIQNLNPSIRTTTIDVTKMPELHYFGYKLNRNVVVKGNLGDRTAERMESGMLIVDGNCKGIVGPFMKGGVVDVKGTIRDVGAVRYGGTITFKSNLRNYYSFVSIEDVRKTLEHEQQYPLGQVASQIRSGSPVSLHTEFKRMLHPKLVQLICEYNIGIYQRELSTLSGEYNGLIEQNEGLERSHRDNVGRYKIAKGLTATGVAGIFAPPLLLNLLMGGFLMSDASKRIKDAEDKLKLLEGQLHSYKSRIEETQQLIQEARRFY